MARATRPPRRDGARAALALPAVERVDAEVLRLAAGVRRVVLRTNGPSWRPGTTGPARPLVLARQTADAPVVTVPVARVREPCGRGLDRAEALRA